MARRSLIFACATLVLAAVGAGVAGLAWGGKIDPIAPPQRQSFDAGTIARGASLAAIGNCIGCHTSRDAAPFSGGVPLKTQFGTIYSSNITPDDSTGIGNWSQAAFMRAMHDGVARDGTQLYPTFPYDHFTHSTDDDLASLYAYLMTRTPVNARPPSNAMHFPFNVRALVVAWKFLYLDRRPLPTDEGKSAQWNRGAYLTESLAHCGACHTPRNALGAEQHQRAFNGARIEGWYAPPLDADSPSPQPWDVAKLTDYLRTGLAHDHAIAGGPMQGVTAALADASAADVQAIAVYIESLMNDASAPASASRQQRAAESASRAQQPLASASTREALAPSTSTDAQQALGGSVYANSCAGCHDVGRAVGSHGALRLPLAVALYDADPRSFLRIVREGIVPPDGKRGRWMPAFGGALTDEQLTALAAYLRHQAAGAAPWPDLAQATAETRAPPTTAQESR